MTLDTHGTPVTGVKLIDPNRNLDPREMTAKPVNHDHLVEDMDLKVGLTLLGSIDVAAVLRKDKEYGSSWRKRGGVGAFMMLARKWDRIEEQVKKQGYNIFKAIMGDRRHEGLLDDIRDLRRYLLLVEEHLVAAGVVEAEAAPSPKETP